MDPEEPLRRHVGAGSTLRAAAEVQWDLLPPLSCSTDQLDVGGILEPPYDTGGDSFD
jgi:hypothetical protein